MVIRLKGVETPLVDTSELKISGHHNVINALCAATAALTVGADVDGVCRGLVSFQPLEHRVEPVARSMACAMLTIPRQRTPMRSKRP